MSLGRDSMRPMLSRLPWEHSSSSSCTCHMISALLSLLYSQIPLASPNVTFCYLRRCFHVWPQVSTHRCGSEALAGLLLLSQLCFLLHLLQLGLLVAVLQVLHQDGHDHIDEYELSSEHERDKVDGRDEGKVREAVAIQRATLSQRVLENVGKRTEIIQQCMKYITDMGLK